VNGRQSRLKHDRLRTPMDKKVAVITGGVGGAKLVEGLYHHLPNDNLSIIPNVGDDDEFHGLYVSPDVDTLVYTLANLVNRDTGWGLQGDSFKGLGMLQRLGQEDWMSLGDEDLGLHIFRTMRRLRGERPSEIASDIARLLGVAKHIPVRQTKKVLQRLKDTLAQHHLELE